MQDFRELLEYKEVSVLALSEWCLISRQMIYRYIRGEVNPAKLTYLNVTSIATFLDVHPDVVYNAICESFERTHTYDEDTNRWF